MTRTEFVLEFDRLSHDVDLGPKSISNCREVEHVVLTEVYAYNYEANLIEQINTGWAN